MILVLVEASVAEHNRDRFLELARAQAKASRAEGACLAFDIYEDPHDRGSLRFVEEWLTAHDLEQHLETPHTQAFLNEALPLPLTKTTPSGSATTVRAPLRTRMTPCSPAKRRATLIRSASISATEQPSKRDISPGCGVRTVGAWRS